VSPAPPLAALVGRATQAELRKLATSRLAIAGWLFLWGVTGVVVFGIDVVVVNAAEQSPVPGTLPGALAWTHGVRNFYLAQIWLVVLTASSFAGEFSARTLREDVATATPRWAILLAKWVSLGAWSLVALLGQTLVGVLFGLGALEVGGAWGQWLGAVAGTLVTDLSFVAFALLVAILARRVAPAIVAALLVMGVERALAAALYIVSNLDPSVTELMFPGIPLGEIAAAVLPYMPASAWDVGNALAFGNPVDGLTWLALAAWTVLFAGAATALFERLDVP